MPKLSVGKFHTIMVTIMVNKNAVTFFKFIGLDFFSFDDIFFVVVFDRAKVQIKRRQTKTVG